MARIELHPDVDDYFLELTLPEIASRGGVADLFEEGRLIILKDYVLEFDFASLAGLVKSISGIADHELRRRLKKVTANHFFEGKPPVERNGRLHFADPRRQAVFEVLCHGDRDVFERAALALKRANEQAEQIFEICFPDYDPFRLIPSVRLTTTMFENLHWDNHNIPDDFHQARIFANLDTRPRIWNTGHRFPEWVRIHYDEFDLGRFARKDPNLLIDFVTGEILGGTRKTWMDKEPRHRIAFDPGEVWLGESRLISHQIYYGEAAMVYMWFVRASSMANPENRFNARLEKLHREMSEAAAA
jgi:hypothetical protein